MPRAQISTGPENKLGAVQGFEAGRYRGLPDARITVLVNSVGITSEGLAAVGGVLHLDQHGGVSSSWSWRAQRRSRSRHHGPRQRGVLARATRHHEDHARLDAGALDDYLPFSQHEIENADLVGRAWTADQLQLTRHRGPLRLVHGRPGSGKTTVLRKAVEARSGQRVLYLTWSRELTAVAEKHFRAFALAYVRVEARDFATLPRGEVCGADVERPHTPRPVRRGHCAARAPAGRIVGEPRRGATSCSISGSGSRRAREQAIQVFPWRSHRT